MLRRAQADPALVQAQQHLGQRHALAHEDAHHHR
jgi:hypothetical protein